MGSHMTLTEVANITKRHTAMRMYAADPRLGAIYYFDQGSIVMVFKIS